MKNDLKDILSHLNKDIPQDKLLEYLSNKLSQNEQHDLEKQMMNDDFLSDAVEGLEQIENKKDISEYILQLNADLKTQLDKKKKRKEKRKIPPLTWTYITIILLLILVVVSYVIVRRLR